MLAMGFGDEPSLLIADEPTTAPDLTIQVQILSLMLELGREFGTSIILMSHDLGVVAETADRVGMPVVARFVPVDRSLRTCRIRTL
jgi:ABC-type dipeptide/oligopeptide/nickel transport system ATPase component